MQEPSTSTLVRLKLTTTWSMVMVAKEVEAQFVELMVPLYSYGCGKKIKKALAHFKGIYSVNVDYKQQKVMVWGICNKNEVLSTVRTKRKGARFWNQLEDDLQEDSPSLRRCRSINGASFGPLSLNWKAAWKKVFNRSNSF
ncbi:putative heavy metal-associated domain, HMA, heavy metal-associated domain superfamily [Helianthus debilis subsp. tardiflorus]